ncbi:hypothetical protein FIA58_001220 [Flavobacterium jejuense]|uniref:START domain-containing protein n=1 Tax=Flavobacterium jejuense TaxID=1544455 RepID=A0ABX0IQ83_9FLAO|nr:hypothetical protein [Flavobacterium jejuense]NHN24281.1 hypothetical protein [Flavobacterium jejuense]
MKQLFLLFFLLPLLNFSQKKDCKYDFEEKTDSTYIKALNSKLVYEKVFGNSKEFIQFNLINNNGVPTLSFQQIQKSFDFIPVKCFNKKSKIIFQLENGSIITLISSNDETCSALSYIAEEKSNIRLLTGYFMFTKMNYEDLKKSRIIVMRVQFSGETKDYILPDAIESEILNQSLKPSSYFIDYLRCIE